MQNRKEKVKMTFTETDNGYIITHKNGCTAKCDSLRELREVCHQAVEYARLLGHTRRPDTRRAVPCGELVGGREGGEKKKVRINILPDEFLGFEKEKTPHKSLAAGCGV